MAKLNKDERKRLGQKVCSDYDSDYQANLNRFEKIKRIMDIVTEDDSYADEFSDQEVGSYILPLITTAAITFNSISYPAILNDGQPVKAGYYGNDEDGQKAEFANLYSEFACWQLKRDIEHWTEELDKSLMMLPIIGCLFKKVYPDTLRKKVCSDLIMPYQLVVHPSIKSLKTAPVITHVVEYYKHECISKVKSGDWFDVDIFKLTSEPIEKLRDDESTENMGENAPLVFLEQHRREDIDGDGYPEPIIVTVHKDSGEVVKVEKNYLSSEAITDAKGNIINAEPIQYFEKYGFFRDPAGSIYDIGFGQIFFENMDAINSAVNMLLDSAHRANLHTGLIGKGGVRMPGGSVTLEQGQFKFVESYGSNLRDNVLQFEAKEPSPVLFQLLGFMADFVQKTTSMQDSMLGEAASNQAATTTVSLIEQGMQQYKAVILRIMDSLDKEFNLILDFNAAVYQRANPFNIDYLMLQDYEANFFIKPTIDINNLTSSIKMSKAQVMIEASNSNIGNAIDTRAVAFELFEGLKIGDPNKFLISQDPSDMQIALQMEQEKNNAIYAELELTKEQNRNLELQIKMAKSESEIVLNAAKTEKTQKEVDKLEAEIDNVDAETIKTLADAREQKQNTDNE